MFGTASMRTKRKKAVQGQAKRDKFTEAAADFRGGPAYAPPSEVAAKHNADAPDLPPYVAAPVAPAPRKRTKRKADTGAALVPDIVPVAAPPVPVLVSSDCAEQPALAPTIAKSNDSGTGSAVAHWHTCEDMHEVKDDSADLVIGASVYLGKGVPWEKYVDLYHQVYNHEVKRILKPGGWFVTLQTDAYVDGGVLPRNVLLPNLLMDVGKWRLLDVKIWQRRAADFFQPPYSQVCVWGLQGSKHTRSAPNKHRAYLQGIWDYPQQAVRAKGAVAELTTNAYPAPLCKLLVEAFTRPGDTIVDCFAGTGLLLGIAKALGRHAVGYEINKDLQATVAKNINTGEFSLLKQAELFAAPTGATHGG